MRNNQSYLPAAGLCVLALAISDISVAQFQIEEIVVTARKRAESLQDVPDAITAFGQDQIESAGIRDFKGFANLTPNLSMNDNYRPGTARISIRGMITPQVGDAPVAYVVDGITAPSMDFINQDLYAIERIEVLKGPQGALYGKGAVGGAINIVTQQPTNEVEGGFTIGAGNGESYNATGFVSGPLIEDKLLYRLGASYKDSEGLIDNEFLDQPAASNEVASVSGLLTYTVNEDATLDLRARYSQQDAGIGYYRVLDIDDDINSGFSREPNANIPGWSDRELFEASAKLNWAFSAGDLTVIGGYSELEEESFSDSDYTSRPSDFVTLFAGAQETLYDVKAYTSEVRFTSNDVSHVEWQIGAYYQYRKINSVINLWEDFDGTNARTRNSFAIPRDEFLGQNPDPFFETEYLNSIIDENTSDSWAVFGQLGYELSDALSLSMALRYDVDKRESFDWRDVEGTRASETFRELQPKFQLSYHLGEETMAYLSVSKGFRSGGFNEPHPDIVRVFDKEVSRNTELGVKSTLLDGDMTLTAAVFNIDIEDTQYTRLNVDTFTLENLGIDETRSRGFELETVYLASDQFRISASYGYVKSEIEAFDADPELGDLNGDPVPGVYEYNLNLGVEYRIPLKNSSEIQMRVDYLQNGPIAWALGDSLETPATRFVNTRVSFHSESVSVTLFVENLTDERMPSDAFVLDYGLGRQPNFPRRFGAELSYTF